MVQDYRELWAEVVQLFSELAQAWANVGSDDPQIQWLRGRLVHFRTLATKMKLFFTAILSCMVLTAHAGYRYIYNPKIASRVIRPAATETSI